MDSDPHASETNDSSREQMNYESEARAIVRSDVSTSSVDCRSAHCPFEPTVLYGLTMRLFNSMGQILKQQPTSFTC